MHDSTRVARVAAWMAATGSLFAMIIQGCGDIHTSTQDHTRTGTEDPRPEERWRPKEVPPGGCSYGYGEECPKPAVDCSKAPCVHGMCVDGEAGSSDYCVCDQGYGGLLCDTCAEGYRPEGLKCVPRSPCSDAPCVFGTCRDVDAGFVCDCYEGYSGRLCDSCDRGYHLEGMECVPD